MTTADGPDLRLPPRKRASIPLFPRGLKEVKKRKGIYTLGLLILIFNSALAFMQKGNFAILVGLIIFSAFYTSAFVDYFSRFSSFRQATYYRDVKDEKNGYYFQLGLQVIVFSVGSLLMWI